MSELQLTAKIIDEVRKTFVKHDEQAEDTVVYAQYLSALLGASVAELKGSEDELKNLRAQLYAFSDHVFEQQFAERQDAQPQEDAFGVWKPGDN